MFSAAKFFVFFPFPPLSPQLSNTATAIIITTTTQSLWIRLNGSSITAAAAVAPIVATTSIVGQVVIRLARYRQPLHRRKARPETQHSIFFCEDNNWNHRGPPSRQRQTHRRRCRHFTYRRAILVRGTMLLCAHTRRTLPILGHVRACHR
jgi:hypothetical protein